MARFVVFGTNSSDDIAVNVDHVIAVEQIVDINSAGKKIDTCRLWLTRMLWNDDELGQDYVDVLGCLFDVHNSLND